MLKILTMNFIDEKVKHEICKYLEVPIYNSDWGFCVYGGFLRDIIANNHKKINDLDILVDDVSRKQFSALFEVLGWSNFDFNSDLDSLYNLDIIDEPITYVKGNKTVQLIQPRVSYWNAHFYNDDIEIKDDDINTYLKLFVENVDYTINAVGYYKGELKYYHEDTELHLNNECFDVIPNALMLNGDVDKRAKRLNKFIEKGWIYLGSKKETKSLLSGWGL